MDRRWMRFALVPICACVAWFGSARAENSVTVESRVMQVSDTGQTIAVKLVNEDTLKILILPLEIRSLTGGCMPERLALSFSERLTSALNEMRISNMYPEKGADCKGAGGTSAYKGVLYSGADTSYPVSNDPWGIILAAAYLFHLRPLLPGSDSVGSLILTVDAPDDTGSFIIDTTCVSPSNHLQYIIPSYGESSSEPVDPSFTAGIVTVTSCNCTHHGDLNDDGQIDALDFNALLDWIFYGVGPPPADAGCPHVNRGDVNCDGTDDALDLNYLTDYLFFGGPAPCDPCTCNPYPSSCP